jgi:hypothetical protein
MKSKITKDLELNGVTLKGETLKKAKFVNAQLMAKKNPSSFEVPTNDELDGINVGANVKVCTGDERFWVDVSEVKGNKIVGTVNNDLFNTDIHGLGFGDVVSFFKKNVYSIFFR